MIGTTFFEKLKHTFIFRGTNRARFVSIFLLIILPLALLGGYSIKKEYEHFEVEVFEHSRTLVQVSSFLIEEHLSHMVDMSISLASRPLVERGAEKGKWDEAEAIIHDAPGVFPYIDSIALLDTEGTLKAITPPAPSIIGKNFAYRDYYQVVSKNWQPYVSPVFKKAGGNQEPIVSIVVPIWSVDSTRPTGMLAMGVKLDAIDEWSKRFETEAGDIAYVVDQKETPVIFNDPGAIPSASAFRKKLARGVTHEGVTVEITENTETKEMHLVAHAPITRYGWGVVFARPTTKAFAEQQSGLIRIVIPWVLALVFVASLLYFILKNQEDIRSERDREQMFLDSIGDGVVAIDRNWNITLWNRAASTISGWSGREVIGKQFRSVVKFLKESDRTEYITFIEDAMVSGNVRSVDRGLVLVRKDGSEVAVSDSASAVVNMQGTSEGAIIIFRDVTQERESERLRTDFAYAAHQLRTPVTEALWNIETAQKERNAKKRNESLDIAHSALLNVKDLEEHLITVSEIDKGIVSPWVSYVVVSEMCADIERTLRQKAEARNVKLSFDLAHAPKGINTDQKLLKVVLCEVIENALLYSREGGTVVVRAVVRDKDMVFEVEDHGVGISLDEQPIVFTKFFRGSNRGAQSVGSGLGLFVAKEYTRIIDGKIWFISEEGKGATFFIAIPLR